MVLRSLRQSDPVERKYERVDAGPQEGRCPEHSGEPRAGAKRERVDTDGAVI